MRHSITVRYECDTCHKKTKTIKYNGKRYSHYTCELQLSVKGWFIYGGYPDGSKPVHECPDCHTKRIARMPEHLR